VEEKVGEGNEEKGGGGKREEEERGKGGEGCVMAVGGWTPLPLESNNVA